MSFSSLSSYHLERNLKNKHTQSTKHEAQTENKQGVSQFSPEKESRVTAAFQSGAFFPFPPGSNCLFCSLGVLRLRFSWVAAVEEMSSIVFVSFACLSTLSVVGDEIFFLWLEPTPAVKMPEAMVRVVSHIPSFGGHCCPGVSRPVPADGDSSSFSSGPILPSLLSNLTYTLDEGSGSSGQGLECCRYPLA